MWFYFRKGVVTASKFHNVLTKMAKISKGGGDMVVIWKRKTLSYFLKI